MKVAYYIEQNYQYFDYARALYSVMPGLIITINPEIAKELSKWYNNILLGNNHGSHLFDYVNVDVIVYPGNRVIEGHDDKFRVFTNHGVSDKAYLQSIDERNFDLILLAGRKDFDILKNSGKDMSKYEVCGYAKFSKMGNIEPVKLFDNENKTILYAPTWNYALSSGELNINSYLRFLKGICEAVGDGYNLIIKPHPAITQMISRDLYELGNERPNSVRYVSDYRSIEYMVNSDLLITDVSSVAYEWLYFDRPMVFINPDPGALSSNSKETAIWKYGKVVDNIRDLRSAIDFCLANPSLYSKEKNNLFNYAFFNPRNKDMAKFACEVIRKRYEIFKERKSVRE